MFWAINKYNTGFDPPNIVGNFTISIDDDCLIQGGNGTHLVGEDFVPEHDHKTFKGMLSMMLFFGMIFMYFCLKYIK